MPSKKKPGAKSKPKLSAEDEAMRKRLNTYMERAKQGPSDVALDLSMRGTVRVSYLQVYRWSKGISSAVTDRRAELDAFLKERGF